VKKEKRDKEDGERGHKEQRCSAMVEENEGGGGGGETRGGRLIGEK